MRRGLWVAWEWGADIKRSTAVDRTLLTETQNYRKRG